MNSLDPWRTIVTDPYDRVIYPAASFGHPFYRGNTFVGADAPRPPRRGITAEVAPILAPASGGFTVRKDLDAQQVLRVEIEIDGRTYRTSMDLAPIISALLGQLAQWHADQHARGMISSPSDAEPAVVSSVEAAVGQATDQLVDELVGCHCGTICGSFLGDISNAVKGVAHGVASAAGKIGSGVRDTLKKLKGPIAAAATVAAASAAAAIPGVGPLAAPIAGKLAGDLVNAASGDTAAKKQVAQAQQQAKTDPVVAAALSAATHAVANATVDHHVAVTARQAAAGHRGAQQQIAQVHSDAQQGDPAASAVLSIISRALGQASAPAATSSSPGLVAQYLQPALNPASSDPGLVADYLQPATNASSDPSLLAQYLQPAIDASSVAGWYDVVGAWPWYDVVGGPSTDLFSSVARLVAQHEDFWNHQSQLGALGPWYRGSWLPFFNEWDRQRVSVPKDALIKLMGLRRQAGALGIPVPSLAGTQFAQVEQSYPRIEGWYDIVGAAHPLSAVRDYAHALATSQAANAVGVIRTSLDHRWHTVTFDSLDEAIDWLQRASYNKDNFTYAAVFEKTRDGSAFAQGEEFGRPRRPSLPSSQQMVRRDVATINGWG